jgi:hypothetical protein
MKARLFAVTRAIVLLVGTGALLVGASAQNIVENDAAPVVAQRRLEAAELNLLDAPLVVPVAAKVPQGEAAELRARVDELISGWPWLPFFHQLGISGSETHFGHADELFHALSAAIPWTEPAQAGRIKEFLAARLREIPPYAVAGFAPNAGQARERYDVSGQLRARQPAEARDLWGVYAYFEYVTATGDRASVPAHWPAIRQRIAPVLEKACAFDARGTSYRHDESERLNGDLAGLYAAIHLSRLANDPAIAEAAKMRAGELMQLRLDLERLNPRIMEPTDVATKSLHHAKLGRYLHLPEPMLVLLRHDQTAAKRIRPFREARPGWWMAFGDRFIGGENYTTSPDFARAVFIAATQLEPCPPEMSAKWIDVPWCKADLYFIERLAMFLQSAAGK